MEIINLTPHAIAVQDSSGDRRHFAPSGSIARVESVAKVIGEIDGVPVSRATLGAVTGLPPAVDGVVFLVSAMVAQAAGRPDVVSPDTGPTAIRENGQVVAVRGFTAWHRDLSQYPLKAL